MATGPADAMKMRLRADLKAAMQSRQAGTVKALRILLGAIDNAEAVPAEAELRTYVAKDFGDGSAEAPRRALTAKDVQAVLRREADGCRAAADEMARCGRPDRAEALAAEAAIMARYLRP